MADWNLPTLPSTYALFLQYLKERDEDLAKKFNTLPTNPLANMIRLERPTNTRFQEYSGGLWVDRAISVQGGGTGAATASDARTNLGLGTIATQNANNVNITGGSIAGVTLGGTITGTFTGDGSGLTDINGSEITTGTIGIARMPVGGGWPTLTSRLTFDGNTVKINGLAAGRQSPGAGTITLGSNDTAVFVQGGPATINLPDATVAANDGKIYFIKKEYSGGGAVTIDAFGGQFIDGATTLVLDRNLESVILQCNSSGWTIIGGWNNAGMVSAIAHYSGSIVGGSVTTDVTITSVDTTKSLIIPRGVRAGTTSFAANGTFEFTSATNVRITRGADVGLTSVHPFSVITYDF